MKPAIFAAIVFVLGVAPGIAGYEGPPPPNPGPAHVLADQAAADKDARPAPKHQMFVAVMLQKLKQRWSEIAA